MPRTLALIVAMAENRAIGIDNTLPWRCPEDLRHFKALTLGHTLIMGRKTFDSIGKPLPGRDTIVLTRDPSLVVEGCRTATSLEAALALCPDDTVFIAGGAEIYRLALPLADRIHLTEIKTRVEGDAYFPEIDPADWQETGRENRHQDAPQALDFDFVTLQRRR